MTIPKKYKKTLINALEIYDENQYYYNYKRKAYNDDSVLIEDGVDVNNVIAAFQLKKNFLYKNFLTKVKRKNDKKKIEELIKNNNNYTIFKLEINLNNYDYGNHKYDRLNIQEIEYRYEYDNKKNLYDIFPNYGGYKIDYNMTYMDLIDDTYKTIKDVVNRIKKLEENKTKK